LEINYRYTMLRARRRIVQSKADTELVRRQNRGLVLGALRRAGPLARVELGRETGLSPATISAITGDLLAEHILVTADIDERAERPLGRGRPRVALTLNDEAAYVLGVKISLHSVTLLLSDYSGHLRDSRHYAISTMGADSRSFVPRLIDCIRGYLADRDIPPSRVSEISIAIPGTTDETTGTLLWSPTVDVDVGPIPGPVNEALGIRASMTNDVNMMAQALHSRDPIRFGGTFATIFIAYGVGMGLYINGRLFTGAYGSGAEFGHANHMPGGALCRCRRLCDLPGGRKPGSRRVADGYRSRRRDDAPARGARARRGGSRAHGLSPGRPGARLRPVAADRPAQSAARRLHGARGRRLRPDGSWIPRRSRRGTGGRTRPHDRDLVDVGILAGAMQRLDREVFASSDHDPVVLPKPAAAVREPADLKV
jgi:hypothetical protein